MPLVIGVTGSVATGKSLVCNTLVELGAVHCDADKLVHRLYDPGKPAFDRIVAVFGQEVVGADGYIDRKLLGSKVFGKPEEMQKLYRAIGDIGAAVKGVIDEWRQTLPRDAVAVMEAVNHVEAGYGNWCDRTWLVKCETETARRRLVQRNGFSLEEASQRLASQRPWEERALAADLVLSNDGTPEELVGTVKAEFARAYELAQRGKLPASRYYTWWKERLGQAQQRAGPSRS